MKAHEIAERLKGAKKNGSGWMACCPAHADKNPSLSISERYGKVLLHCHAGCQTQDIVAAMGLAMRDLMGDAEPEGFKAAVPAPVKESVQCTYDYTDQHGKLAYQVLRMIPKNFRQRRPDGQNGWIWNMNDVSRVPYRLPEVIKAEIVALCEGEKDADNLTKLGWCGTATVGGSNGWLPAYADFFKDKDVLIFPDQDNAGEKYRDAALESIGPVARTCKIVNVRAGCKDVSDFITLHGDKAKEEIEKLIADAPSLTKGVYVPIYTAKEAEERYIRFLAESKQRSFDLSKFLPSLGRFRPLVPGELVALVADTGVGKTAILQNIARAAHPLPTLFFELELPIELMFERQAAIASEATCQQIEREYRAGARADMASMSHIFVSDSARMTTDDIEKLIVRSELKIGRKPAVVCIDYLGLISGKGKRYERTSDAAEDLKRIAKSTGTIMFMSSQVHREREDHEIKLHDAKDSGSIEASSGMVLGAWRDQADSTGGTMVIKVLKCTKGKAGLAIACNFDGETLRITERYIAPGHK